ncbi:MAG: hypothetical protein QGH42_03990 [Kiritimatiellia bacterium]|jgi:hypothetical protein|nr:hypothetical protein [Kiritimatiellia bacterium]MDP6810885.1 hypothetical protein [Kiritimatiellia bacterium]MDP7023397.1 hypothetical protein [Kiritimatiellia bacterium]
MSELKDLKQLLHTCAYHRVEIDRYLDPDNPAILKFDPELGYLHQDHCMKDGQAGAVTAGTYARRGGHRKMINYADQPCRINTYGDSYTQCAQVSDGETWQEALAANFREPIRNFGVGGYGVYQAYRRAMRVEAMNSLAAENIILNVWDDDYMRNIDAARWVRVAWMMRDLPRGKKDGYPVHGFPWSHLRFDLKKGAWEERSGMCKKTTDLLDLVGKRNFFSAFKDDPVAHLYCLREGGEAPIGELEELAEAFGLKVNLRNARTRQADALELHHAYGIESTKFTVDKLRKWCKANKRKLMILLSYDVPTVQTYAKKGTRFDQRFVDFLDEKKFRYIDTLPTVVDDARMYKGTIEQFCERLYVERAGAQVFGHYNPYGNFCFANAIRQGLIDWLNPKPLTYRD